MENQMPPIPTFLLRGHVDCVVSSDRTNFEAIIYGQADMPQVKNKLTAAFKGRVAQAVISAIKAGDDTFGKLRKALPNYQDSEIRAGIRFAKKWIPMLERKGTRAKPYMQKYQARVVSNGKRYEIVTYSS
jgi:hypothetical protein